MVKEPFNGYFSDKDFAETVAELLPIRLGKGLEKLLEKGPFVDLGCGAGHVLAAFQERYPNLKTIGIDINDDYLKEAKKRSPKSSVIEADLEKLPFEDNSIPVLFSSKIYQMCNEDNVEKILNEVFRVLKPGSEGVYLLTAESNFKVGNGKRFNDIIKDVGFKTITEKCNEYMCFYKALRK